MMADESTSTQPAELSIDVASTISPTMRRRVLTSAFLGSVIEWYDFYLFGFASAAVFSVLFFPEFSPTAGTLASFATLGAGFLARPLGGLIWGHFGDRVGRKAMLVLSIALMGAATTAIGLLPSFAQIGMWAPILLVTLRLIQGLAAGGEWGGAVLMAMEHSRHKRRGLAGSIAQMGAFGGILVANGVLALTAAATGDHFVQWGWRIPFVASALLLVFALWVRLGVQESPIFKEAQRAAASRPSSIPAVQVLRHPRTLVIAMMLVIGPFAGSAVFLIFAVSYALEIGYAQGPVLTATVVASATSFLCQPIFGALSDRIGRRRCYALGAVLMAVAIVAMFALVETGRVELLFLGLALVAATHAVMFGPMAAFLGELFPTGSRYTGASLGYQIAGAVGGGLTPLVATSLLAAAGGPPNSWPISLLMAGLCGVTLLGVLLAPETSRSDLGG